jgi:hypothetical protein
MGETHLITNDQEALEIADRFARQIEAESTNRDKDRRLPFHEMELFSESGLLGMTVPKSYGGPGVSTVTFVIRSVQKADYTRTIFADYPCCHRRGHRPSGAEGNRTFPENLFRTPRAFVGTGCSGGSTDNK